MIKDEIIKQRYPFYNPDIAQKDIEINAEAVKELMEAYLIDQLKGLVKEVSQGPPEYIIKRIKDEISQHKIIRWVSFNDNKPNEEQPVIIFEMDYGAWSCEFEYDKDADYSKSVWCPQPCVQDYSITANGSHLYVAADLKTKRKFKKV